jgi:hypothetical protein
MGTKFRKPLNGGSDHGMVVLAGYVGLNTTGGVSAEAVGTTHMNFGALTKTGTGTYSLTLYEQYADILACHVGITKSAARDFGVEKVEVPGHNSVAAGKVIKLRTITASTGAAADNANEAKTLDFIILAKESSLVR